MSLPRKWVPWSVSILCVAVAVHARDGDLDDSFANSGIARVRVARNARPHAVAVQGDGKIVLAGGACCFDPFDDLEAFALVRYLPSGDLDAGFGEGGTVATPRDLDGQARGLVVQPDGRLLATGWVGEADEDDGRFIVLRYAENGDLDASFGTGGVVETVVERNARANALALQSDDKIVVAGRRFVPDTEISEVCLSRYSAQGVMDTGFGEDGIVTTRVGAESEALAMAVQPDDKIVVVGVAQLSDPVEIDSVVMLARYLPDGSLDQGFGDGGIVVTPARDQRDSAARALLVQADGKIVVAGKLERPDAEYSDFYLLRYEGDGSLDSSFGDGGAVVTSLGRFVSSESTGVVVQPDGKLVATGFAEEEYDREIAVVRHDTAGRLDPSFGSEGIVRTPLGDDARGLTAALYGEERLVVAGPVEVGEFRQEEFLAARYLLAGERCACDCDGKGQVTVDELVTAVSIALGLAGTERCAAADTNGNGQVTVDELVSGVHAALDGC